MLYVFLRLIVNDVSFSAVILEKSPINWKPGAVSSRYQFRAWHHYMLKMLSLKGILVKGRLTEKLV